MNGAKMDLTSVNVVGGALVLATNLEVTDQEQTLGITFPEGYREYVTTLGEGVLAGYVRVYPPWRIQHELGEWRERIREYWFWDAGSDISTREQALESIIVADTLDGDELIFHPSRRGRLLVLPRHSDKIYDAGANLLDAVEWLCSSGILTDRIERHSFEPFDSRRPPN